MKNIASMLRVHREYLVLLELMKEHTELLTNIVIYHYDCKIKTAPETKYIQVKGLCAINLHFELSAEWQVECHIIRKYGAIEFHKTSNIIQPIKLT